MSFALTSIQTPTVGLLCALQISAESIHVCERLFPFISLYSCRRFIRLVCSLLAHMPVLGQKLYPKPSPSHDGKSNSSRLARVAGSTIQMQYLPELFDIEGLNERSIYLIEGTSADPLNGQLSILELISHASTPSRACTQHLSHHKRRSNRCAI